MSAPEPPRLKTLRVIARLNLGGPARHVILLDRGLRACGHRTLLVHGSVDRGEASLEHLALENSVPTLKMPGLARRPNPLGDLSVLVRLAALMFRERPDVVHTHTAKAGTLGRIAALFFNVTRGRRRRCLVVHTFHGHVLSGYFHPTINGLVRLAERTLALITDRIVTISSTQRLDIVERFGIAADSKTVVIPLGLDLDALLQLTPGHIGRRQELSIGRDDIVFGFVGRMVPIKDLGTLLAAFGSALAACSNLILLLVGDGPHRRDLEIAAETAGLSNRVRFTGWDEDLTRVYSTIDVLALSSLNEGTPVAIIEAMAAGKPIVATAVGGVPDVVADGRTGILVPPRQPVPLADAMIALATNPELRRTMGSAGRIVAERRYGTRRLVSDLEALYHEGLQAKRGSP